MWLSRSLLPPMEQTGFGDAMTPSLGLPRAAIEAALRWRCTGFTWFARQLVLRTSGCSCSAADQAAL